MADGLDAGGEAGDEYGVEEAAEFAGGVFGGKADGAVVEVFDFAGDGGKAVADDAEDGPAEADALDVAFEDGVEAVEGGGGCHGAGAQRWPASVRRRRRAMREGSSPAGAAA